MKYLLIFCLFFMACEGDALETSPTGNKDFQVQLLFEHDGCKVYRFYDGRVVYYTDCRGKVEWQTTYFNGKTSYRIHHQVPTN